MVLYFYISTFRSMCAVTSTAVFRSSSMLLRYILNKFEMVPVATIITGIPFVLHLLSLLHCSLAVLKTVQSHYQVFLIHCCAKNFLTIWHVLSISALCIRMYKAELRLSSFQWLYNLFGIIPAVDITNDKIKFKKMVFYRPFQVHQYLLLTVLMQLNHWI